MADIPMPEVMLNDPGVLPVVGDLVPSGVTEHVRVNWEFQPRRRTRPRNHFSHRRVCQRTFPLSREDVRGIRVIPLKAAECSQLRPVKGMTAGRAVL